MKRRSGFRVSIYALIFCWVPFVGETLGFVAFIMSISSGAMKRNPTPECRRALYLSLIAIVASSILMYRMFF